MNLCSLHFLGPCTDDDWLPPCLIASMYLDAFLEAFTVSDVTTLAFFCLGFGLLLLEFWCARTFCVVLPDWCGAASVELCCWVYVLLVLAWGVTFGLDWCILVWDGANWVAELVLAWDGAPGLKLGLLDWRGALGVAQLCMLDWGGAPGVELKLCMLAYKQQLIVGLMLCVHRIRKICFNKWLAKQSKASHRACNG